MLGSLTLLSTPHGTLGTFLPSVETLKLKELSTPHGTLGTSYPGKDKKPHGQKINFQLHTVH